jgi:hypothetical protein
MAISTLGIQIEADVQMIRLIPMKCKFRNYPSFLLFKVLRGYTCALTFCYAVMKLGPEITACCYIGGFSPRSLKSSSLSRHSETFEIKGVIIDTWVPGKFAGSPAHSADRAESHKRVFNKPTKSVLQGIVGRKIHAGTDRCKLSPGMLADSIG